MVERNWQKDWELTTGATPGPWAVEGTGGIHMDGTRDGYVVTKDGCRLHKPWFSYADACFITKAREGWPAALEKIRELEEENRKLREILEVVLWKSTHFLGLCLYCGAKDGHSEYCSLHKAVYEKQEAK